MQNPFIAHERFESKPPRNAFDQSKRVYMTGKIGCLYPNILCEVAAGDSVKIDMEMLFNFFPMIFPIQTPLRASVYIFYGRNRIFWDSWQDFSYNNKQPDHPFILQPQGKFWKTGSLADYLGVPTTYSRLASGGSTKVRLAPTDSPARSSRQALSGLLPRVSVNSQTGALLISNSGDLTSYSLADLRSGEGSSLAEVNVWFWCYEELLTLSDFVGDLVFTDVGPQVSSGNLRYIVFCEWEGEFYPLIVSSANNTGNSKITLDDEVYFASSPGQALGSAVSLGTALRNHLESNPGSRFVLGCMASTDYLTSLFNSEYFIWQNSQGVLEASMLELSYDVSSAESVDLSELDSNPFAGSVDNPPQIPLNAIPFRFYEAVYNAFFRNERNDPFIVDGEPEYNKYNTTRADGADSTNYELKYRNWESDFLTSATQTPQQGIAPLVGVNVRGDFEFLNEDGTITKIRPKLDSDGSTVVGVDGVIENPTQGAMRSVMDLVTSGIAINDLRQVGSFQEWLENNLRRGLKYRDQVKANTGVDIRYDELDMPEFLGGFSRPVQVTSITQATPSTASDNALGDRAGQASLYGGSKHSITHYCDEAGYIMAIVCVTPQPVYTQLLPKFFLKSDALSYYHPKFGTIGMQPITYKEVCPIQAFYEGSDLNSVFGYQRPWYDLISAVDEAHGNMRTNMRDYLMHRTFVGQPRLGAEFLHIDPKQLNDVFSITDETEDVYQGQIAFNVFTKRAIPRYGIPRKI